MDKYGNLLRKRKDVKDRWRELFKVVLNRETPGNPLTITDEVGFDLEDEVQEMAVNKPTLGEVKEAVKKLKSWKAPGIDNITAELLKTNVEFSARKIHKLLSKVWKFEAIPEAWKEG